MKFFIRPKGYVCYKPVIVYAKNEDEALQKIQDNQDSLILDDETKIIWEDSEIVKKSESTEISDDLLHYYVKKKKEEDRLIGISCHYWGGDEVEINIGKRALTKLAEYIMCVAQEGRHDPELDEVFSIIVGGAQILRCKLPSDVFKAFKKFMRNERHTEI